MTKTTTRSMTIVFIAVGSLSALGCTQSIDGAKVETSIKETCTKNGLTLASITCPRDQKVQQGATFSCTSSSADGDAITWEVTQTDAAGAVDFRGTGIMDEQKLGDQIEPQLKEKVGSAIDMKCPTKWIVAKAGAKFSCDATVEGKATPVDCLFSDDSKYNCQLHSGS
jgi:hypothetical protein